MSAYTPRFDAYAASLGLSPEAALEHDAEKYPGGKMTGFILWTSAKWAEWRKLRGHSAHQWLSPADQDDFTAWVSQRPECVVGAALTKAGAR